MSSSALIIAYAMKLTFICRIKKDVLLSTIQRISQQCFRMKVGKIIIRRILYFPFPVSESIGQAALLS